MFGIIVRGPLGVGKTTVATELARRLRAAHIQIDAILEQEELEVREAGYISERSFLRANDFVLRQAQRAFRSHRPVVIDGNFYWTSAIDDLRRRLPVPLHVFTLSAPLALCVERDASRELSHGPGAARSVYRKSLTAGTGTVVDARPPVEVVASEIQRNLRAPKASRRATRRATRSRPTDGLPPGLRASRKPRQRAA